jgi:hypothetical protein
MTVSSAAETTRAPHGRELRVTFRQFDGEMLGSCWCGRTWTSASPRRMWDWLDDHDHTVPEHGKATDGR